MTQLFIYDWCNKMWRFATTYVITNSDLDESGAEQTKTTKRLLRVHINIV